MRAGRSRCLALLVMAAAVAGLSVAGCHSAYVSASVQNRTSQPVSVVEVDYPSASFGTQSLAPGETLNYRFKVLGSGDLKLLWTDVRHQDHAVNGPHLDEGAEGMLRVEITPNGVHWTAPKR